MVRREIHVIITAPSDHFRDLYHWLISDETHVHLTKAWSPINSMGCSGIYDNICGARGPFLVAAAAMVLVVGCLFPSFQGWK